VQDAEALRPSIVATSRRSVTQTYALGQLERHPHAAGLRWWSALEASWMHVTVSDRALGALTVRQVHIWRSTTTSCSPPQAILAWRNSDPLAH
jgi:hypothetical protein